MTGRRVVQFLALVAILAPACATSGSDTGGAPGADRGDGETFDWADPMPNGEQLTSLADADIVFTPAEPKSLGAPLTVRATPDTTEKARRALGLTYQTRTGGRLVVFEYVTDGAAAVEELVGMGKEQKGCSDVPPIEGLGASQASGVECHFGDRTLVDLTGGVKALLLDNGEAIGLLFVLPLDDDAIEALTGTFTYPALQVELQAPSSEVSGEELIALGNEMAGATR